MTRPLLLDLYCGAGGAGMGYHRAGFDVVGVDLNPQPNYPFPFYQRDAIEFLREVIESRASSNPWAQPWKLLQAIHASPPCQRYSSLTQGTNAGKASQYPDLLPPTRVLLDRVGVPYVIENVTGAPMRRDLLLCGLNFNLKVFRHRQFEMGGWNVQPVTHQSHRGHRVSGYRHGVKYEGDMYAVYGEGGGKGTVAQWQEAMGIDWTDERKEIAEAIPPAYTEYIGGQLIEQVNNQGGINHAG